MLKTAHAAQWVLVYVGGSPVQEEHQPCSIQLLPFGGPLGPVFPDSNSPELVAEALQSWVFADIQDNELMA